jgi:hypothetical protein
MKAKLIAKITSRKFWVAVFAIVAQIAVLFGADSSQVLQIIALVGIALTSVGYILVEAKLDKTSIGLAVAAAASAATEKKL